MASCPHVFNCPLFAVFTMNSALNIWKMNYCTSEFTRCARHQLTEEGKTIPQNLLPNGKTLKLAHLSGSSP